MFNLLGALEFPLTHDVALQVIGFIYGLIIEQFGWTVYIVLGGFAVSCAVSFNPLLSECSTQHDFASVRQSETNLRSIVEIRIILPRKAFILMVMT